MDGPRELGMRVGQFIVPCMPQSGQASRAAVGGWPEPALAAVVGRSMSFGGSGKPGHPAFPDPMRGEGGIRTLETFSRLPDYQSGALSHSATPDLPLCGSSTTAQHAK